MTSPKAASAGTSGGRQALIHVCSLDRVPKTVARERASHLVTLLHSDSVLATPVSIAGDNHLRLSLHDIALPQAGMIHPGSEHIERLLAFAARWDRSRPMVVHCLAGISRSTAAAFIVACALNPRAPEGPIAQHIRALSPTASPNRLLVELADEALGRDGRMIQAIEVIGRGEPAMEGWPFSLPATWPV